MMVKEHAKLDIVEKTEDQKAHCVSLDGYMEAPQIESVPVPPSETVIPFLPEWTVNRFGTSTQGVTPERVIFSSQLWQGLQFLDAVIYHQFLNLVAALAGSLQVQMMTRRVRDLDEGDSNYAHKYMQVRRI
ncbi:hypothetical protein BDR03DRAFT_507751 [Suillus americanus]|nr:hypothetical protein BDR03DRAFT_507751 [Suillus americanus]